MCRIDLLFGSLVVLLAMAVATRDGSAAPIVVSFHFDGGGTGTATFDPATVDSFDTGDQGGSCPDPTIQTCVHANTVITSLSGTVTFPNPVQGIWRCPRTC